MPTFGWVHEDAWEAVLQRTERVPEPARAAPAFPCPFCVQVLGGPEKLRRHIAAAHKIDRPILLVGRQEPHFGFAVRTRRAAADFVIANATTASIIIDGAAPTHLNPGDLPPKLAGLKQATVTLSLANAVVPAAAPVTSTYSLSFRIADPCALKEIERAFQQILVSRDLSVAGIREFLADDRCQGLGRDYTQALSEYALGVLVKERPEGQNITSPLARYRELFGSSLESLSEHQRPLPRLLCSIMSFALNDLSREYRATGFWELDLVAAILRGPEERAPVVAPPPSEHRRRVCPVDHGTGRILDLGVRLSQQERWSPVLDEECRQIAEADTLDLMDRQKALALWAVTAWRLGAVKDATDPLARLSATYPFSTWATSCLETISK